MNSCRGISFFLEHFVASVVNWGRRCSGRYDSYGGRPTKPFRQLTPKGRQSNDDGFVDTICPFYFTFSLKLFS